MMENTTNIDKCSILKEDNPYRIKFLGKISGEFHTENRDRETNRDIYFLECHEHKYILNFEKIKNNTWGTLKQSITLEEVSDYFDVVNTLKLQYKYGNISFYTGQDNLLDKNTNYSPYEIDFKEFFINADPVSENFGIHEYEKFKEVDYIDFTILLVTGDSKVTDYVNQFFKNLPLKDFLPRPAFILKDGTSISIQASTFTYCNPRIDNAEKYTEVEVGFPTKVIEELLPFAEDPEYPTQTVYPYVPVELLNKIIEKEGLDQEFYNKYFKGDYTRER